MASFRSGFVGIKTENGWLSYQIEQEIATGPDRDVLYIREGAFRELISQAKRRGMARLVLEATEIRWAVRRRQRRSFRKGGYPVTGSLP